MKKLNQYIQEKYLINIDTEIEQYAQSLNELQEKYNLKYTKISYADRRYEMSKELSKKFLKFMRQPKNIIHNILTKFIEDNNILDLKKYACWITISGNITSFTTYYYIVINDITSNSTIAQIIYRFGEEIRIYSTQIELFDNAFAQIIDYILQYLNTNMQKIY